MIVTIRYLQLAFVLFAFVAASAGAAPVTWVLQDVAFADGGEGSGHFIFDRDMNAVDGDYLEISITTTAGDDAPGRHYVGKYELLSGATQLLALDSADESLAEWVLALVFDTPLDDSGGVRSLVSIQEGLCGTPTCIPADQIARVSDSSSATIAAVPVPAAVWLFGSSLGFLGWIRRHEIRSPDIFE